MCIAILHSKNDNTVRLTKAELKNCWTKNNDGAGTCYIDDNENFVVNKFMKLKKFIKHYEMNIVPLIGKKNIMVHFRMCSHGDVSVENVHPFIFDGYNNQFSLIHNGTMQLPNDKMKSDTAIFSEMMEFLNFTNFDQIKKYLSYIKSLLGWSKIIFLDKKGMYYIYGENSGYWKDGTWFSNHDAEGYDKWNSYYKETYNGKTYFPSYKSKEEKDDISLCSECQCILYSESEISLGICNKCLYQDEYLLSPEKTQSEISKLFDGE